MLRRQSNIEQVLVAKDVAATSSRSAMYASQLAEGEAAVFTPGGKVATTTTVNNSNTIYIGYTSTNGELIMSDAIDVTTIKNYKGVLSVAAAEQVDYVGYNGTSGDIVATDSNAYYINLWFKGDTINAFMDQMIKYGIYHSDSTATSNEIAAGLAINLSNNLKTEKEHRVRVERVTSGTQLALGTGVDTITLTKGSKYFTCTDIDDATTNAALAEGDALVIGTASTSPVYIITDIDTTTNIGTFDQEFQGESTAILDTAAKRIAAAGLDAAYWGLKLTGVAKSWKLGWEPYSKVSWTIELDGFSTTPTTNSVAANLGRGVYESVAEAEWFAQGNEGGMSRYRTRAYAPAYEARKDTEASHFYSALSFTYQDNYQTDLGPVNNSPKSMLIYLNVGTTAAAGISATSFDDATTGLVTVLDDAVVAAGTGTAQVGNL